MMTLFVKTKAWNKFSGKQNKYFFGIYLFIMNNFYRYIRM